MRKLIALLLTIAAIGFGASAKLTQFILRGYVEKQDYSKTFWDRESVDSVYVDLMKNDTIPVGFKLLVGNDDEKMATDGYLRMIVNGGTGTYSLILTRDGYEPLRHEFKVASEGQDIVYIHDLLMEKRRESTLDEVEVYGTAIKMVMKGDTLVYDSRAFKLAEGSSLDALVRQLPGAQLEEDGSITVNGKKIKSLLLNGNDFFQGDPDVALKNLPAYTVDKIKVYDKASKDDNVTLASHKLSDSPEDENMVMDVTLKKEFSMATIFNLEGGYGPGIYTSEDPKKFDHRYIGRAFVIGFGKNYRWSAYGNVNNIRNTSRANSSNKDWGSGWSPSGELEVGMGGFDVFYNPNKKWEVSANMLFTDEKIEYHQLRSITSFYPTGNLYKRTRNDRNEHRNHLEAGANINFTGDNFWLYFNPNIDWMRSNGTSRFYSADFNRNPDEQSRGAAIDSLFAPGAGLAPSDELRNSVTTSTYQAKHGSGALEPNRLRLSASFSFSWRPTKARGSMGMRGYINDTHTTSESGTLYDQPYMADPDAKPLRREQWADNDSRNTNAYASIYYDWDKSFITEKRMRRFSVSPNASWSMNRDKKENTLLHEALLGSIDPKDNPLPSMTAPENITPLIDPENTLNYVQLSNELAGSARMSFSSELTAPSDSGFNPRYYISVNYNHTAKLNHLSYHKPHLAEPFNYHRDRTDQTDSFHTHMGISSSNKRDFISLSAYYNFNTSPVSLMTMLPSTNSSDPFNIYLGPDDGIKLPTQRSHNVGLYSYYYGNKTHRNVNININYNRYENSTAQTAVFDPATGITTHRPISVDGNWSSSASAGCLIPFGPQECWTAGANVNYNFTNSVDYISAIGAPERSVVRTNDASGSIYISYKLKNGTTFSLNGGTTWQHSTSPRASFTTINAWKSNAGASIRFFLPWQIEGETSLRADFRRGYNDVAMNTTEWIWNASVQKSLLKGALTFKLNAVDILGQLSTVSYNVNAQGRYEYWTNSLPRYAMLTVSYRFNYTPNLLKAN
ncbi:MAG: outer membrane beta-barrel family protein [Muribaculaceae bacterium]|nr:outer membrane beta-barrel family protein [Muribaculaceae bacterium]